MTDEKAIQLQESTAVQAVEVTPMTLINQAQTEGADVERMQQLFSENVRIVKNAEVDFRSQKGRTHYKFTTLDHIVKRVVPVMAKYGLTHSWSTDQNSGQISVTCKLSHMAGHSESVTLSAGSDNTGNKNNIQAIGSTVSYLQRYTIMSILGLSSGDKDDDGQAAEAKQVQYISESEQADLQALIDEVNADENLFLRWAGAPSLEEFPASKYPAAVRKLEKKRGAK
jgi:hypothetical protein